MWLLFELRVVFVLELVQEHKNSNLGSSTEPQRVSDEV